MTATTELTAIERLDAIHELLSSLDLDGPTTREGTAWGSILREAKQLSAEAHAAVQQPNRDVIETAIAKAWRETAFAAPSDSEVADAVLAALAVPATETEWEIECQLPGLGWGHCPTPDRCQNPMRRRPLVRPWEPVEVTP